MIPPPTVDLSRVSVLSEMVVRGGNVTWKTQKDLEQVRATLKTKLCGRDAAVS